MYKGNDTARGSLGIIIDDILIRFKKINDTLSSLLLLLPGLFSEHMYMYGERYEDEMFKVMEYQLQQKVHIIYVHYYRERIKPFCTYFLYFTVYSHVIM